MNAKEIFLAALEKPAAERAAFLDQACAGDVELRARVDALLAAHSEASGLFELGSIPPTFSRPATTDRYEPSPEPGVIIAGRYQLLEKLGEGGMGEVWVARQSEPIKRKVALKLIKKGMDSKAVLKRFEQERQALAVMDHPNIARVIDGGLTESGAPYFVMELVAGLPLTKFCDEAKLPVKERLEIFVAVCQAVQHAHQKGLVHRDLKPANVLVTLVDGKPTPKIIDFGVAKAMSGKLTEQTLTTQFGAVIGTLEYMSPEQAGLTTQDVDTRADIYSLGVMLYELLTGLRPFDSKRLKQAALDEVIRIIKEEEPPSLASRLSTDDSLPSVAAMRKLGPKQLISQVRGELDWIVHKCLEKDRNRRYETANGLARDLQRYLADEPVEARPASAGYKLRKFVRRNRGPVLAAGLVLLTLLVGIVSTTGGLVWAMRERKDKELAWQDALANEAKAIAERDAKDKALTAETKARKAEQKARDQALTALRAMTDEIVESQMARGARLTEENKAFLRKIIKQYEGFAAITTDDAQSRAIKAEGYACVGLMRHRLADFKEAETAYDMATTLYKQLVAESPTTLNYRQWLASNQRNLGLLYVDTGRTKDAERVLADSLAGRKSLAIDFHDRPSTRQELAGIHDSFGTLLRDTGRLKEGEAHYAEALAIRKQLVTEFPNSITYQREAAQSHNNMGALYRMTGRLKDAVDATASALAIRKQLAASDPNRPEFRSDLARSYNNLGVLLTDQGNFAESAAAYADARVIFRQLAAEFPTRPEFRRELARSNTNLAGAYCDMGRPKDAEPAYLEAISGFKQLVADYPALPEFRHNLALSLSNLGLMYSAANRLDEAERVYLEGIVIYKKLVTEVPNQHDIRHSLANILGNLAHLGMKRKDFQGAKSSVEDALPHLQIALRANPKNPANQQLMYDLLLELAHANAALLDQGAALRAAEAIRDLEWDPPNHAYAAARILGQCISFVADNATLDADQRRAAMGFFADQTVVMLRAAVAKGFRDTEKVMSEPYFNPLRGRDDFKKLITDLEAAKPPEKP